MTSDDQRSPMRELEPALVPELLVMTPETTSYQVGDAELGVRQLLVTDPDGYLLHFQSPIGPR